ncbi:hypothetical protein [Tenggerimyces flavus]|uniref:Uncharacterized protein n=1 Tax=Tenggerimyces flavus TaxID=1708749 RepID=A0ABV7YD85_9ACTN|nr:hypothetical protein [Tenggerimyces flavus]MBM7791379.1 hypothetical protein [Tenggerimyces flavus]
MRDREKPFGTLLGYCRTYVHPEVYYDAFETLKYACSLPEEEQNVDTKQFKVELRRVVVGDRAAAMDRTVPDEPLPTKE